MMFRFFTYMIDNDCVKFLSPNSRNQSLCSLRDAFASMSQYYAVSSDSIFGISSRGANFEKSVWHEGCIREKVSKRRYLRSEACCHIRGVEKLNFRGLVLLHSVDTGATRIPASYQNVFEHNKISSAAMRPLRSFRMFGSELISLHMCIFLMTPIFLRGAYAVEG